MCKFSQEGICQIHQEVRCNSTKDEEEDCPTFLLGIGFSRMSAVLDKELAELVNVFQSIDSRLESLEYLERDRSGER